MKAFPGSQLNLSYIYQNVFDFSSRRGQAAK